MRANRRFAAIGDLLAFARSKARTSVKDRLATTPSTPTAPASPSSIPYVMVPKPCCIGYLRRRSRNTLRPRGRTLCRYTLSVS